MPINFAPSYQDKIRAIINGQPINAHPRLGSQDARLLGMQQKLQSQVGQLGSPASQIMAQAPNPNRNTGLSPLQQQTMGPPPPSPVASPQQQNTFVPQQSAPQRVPVRSWLDLMKYASGPEQSMFMIPGRN